VGDLQLSLRFLTILGRSAGLDLEVSAVRLRAEIYLGRISLPTGQTSSLNSGESGLDHSRVEFLIYALRYHLFPGKVVGFTGTIQGLMRGVIHDLSPRSAPGSCSSATFTSPAEIVVSLLLSGSPYLGKSRTTHRP
jgi:hypothetical protein